MLENNIVIYLKIKLKKNKYLFEYLFIIWMLLYNLIKYLYQQIFDNRFGYIIPIFNLNNLFLKILNQSYSGHFHQCSDVPFIFGSSNLQFSIATSHLG